MRNFARSATAIIITLSNNCSFKIYTSVSDLPETWDAIAAQNIFLQTDYLSVLESSAPENMQCRFIAVYCDEVLAGVAVSQFLNMSAVQSFGERDSRLKTKIRHFFFKRFASNVLILGNNMLTGQNAFAFSQSIAFSDGLKELCNAVNAITAELIRIGTPPHLTIFKDFSLIDSIHFTTTEFADYFKFSTQPNMVFTKRPAWHSFDDYLGSLTKKYRDQYKRSRKKSAMLSKKKMTLAEIESHQKKIYSLYRTVARNAPFNTFYLPEDHFLKFKQQLGEKFLFYGYFNGQELVGFNTLIRNGNAIDTYFLGYDEHCQRDNMLYLNMLYDMLGYSINQGYSSVILARTALEIKSSVGAEPEKMIGFIRHSNSLFNKFMPRLFRYFEPKTTWQQRHPFKD